MTSSSIPADELWRIRTNILNMFDDRNMGVHPDLFIDEMTFYSTYKTEMESLTRSKFFVKCMHMLIDLQPNDSNSNNQDMIQGSYINPPDILDEKLSSAPELDPSISCIKGKLLVLFCKDESIGVDTINLIRSYHAHYPTEKMLCIYYGKFTHMSSKEINIQRKDNKNVQYMPAFQFYSTQTQHICNPHAVNLLSETEKQAKIAKWKVREDQIPKWLVTDPLVQWYGIEPGTLVEVRPRRDINKPEYRIVVESLNR